MNHIKNRKGYLIIESMVAIGLITVSIFGIFRLLASSIGLNRDIANRFTATYLAAEGIEVVKNIIDTNISTDGTTVWNRGLGDGVYQVEYGATALVTKLGLVGSADNGAIGALPLKYGLTTGIYDYEAGDSTVFKRNVEIENVSSDEIKVRGIVTWLGKNGVNNTVFLEDHFFNWR